MNLKLNHIGHFKDGSSSIIELIIETDGDVITEEITDMYSRIDEDLIKTLKGIVDELEEQNDKLKNIQAWNTKE